VATDKGSTLLGDWAPSSACPRLAKGPLSAKLGPEEGFVLSRVDGQTTFGAICSLVPFEPTLTISILKRLWLEGAIEVPGLDRPRQPPKAPSAAVPPQSSAPPQASASPAARPSGTAVPKAAPPAGTSGTQTPTAGKVPPGVELTAEQVRRIDQYYMTLEQKDAYALLELGRAADKREVKRAYFKLSKEFHPDRYFGKELGDYRARLTKIFQAIKSAFELLSDDERRTAYDESMRDR
jgi:hypothetical protein